MGLAAAADVYSVYSFLHSKGREPVLHREPSGRFHYFIADASPHFSEAAGSSGVR